MPEEDLRTVGGYQVAEELGHGAEGHVFRGRHAATGREVALKVLLPPPRGPDHDRWRSRLAREIEASRRLSHPNLVGIHDFFEHEGKPVIVMDFVRGPSLRSVLVREGPLASDRSLGIVEALARGMHHAHGLGLIHRDLKPENVILDERGTPTIIDFGLVKDWVTPGSLTEEGAILGTPAYLSPEQVRGETKSLDPRSDVWALGLILYELLSGRNPFDAETLLETLTRITSADPPRPIPRQRDGRDAGDVALWALAKDREQRPRTALELALACVEARAPARRRRLGAVGPAVALGAAGLAVGAIVCLDRGSAPRPPPTPVEPHLDPRSTPQPGERTALTRAELEGRATVTSADVPIELLEGTTPESARWRELAARRAISYALGDANRLRSCHAGDAACSALWAIAALGEGEARPVAEKGLLASSFGVARGLGRLASATDELVARSRNYALTEDDPKLEAFEGELLSLRNAPRGAIEDALAPLTDALVEDLLPASHLRFAPRTGVAARLGRQRLLEALPPRAALAAEAFGIATDEGLAVAAKSARLDAIGARAATVEPRVAVCAVVRASRLRESFRTEEASTLELALSKLGAADSVFVRLALRGVRAACWRQLFDGAGERAPNLERGIAAARAVWRLPPEPPGPEGGPSDERALLSFLIEAERLDDEDFPKLARALPPSDPLYYEVLRLRRGGREAIQAVDALDVRKLSGSDAYFIRSVVALALADLRQPAREAIEARPASRDEPPIPRLATDAVRRYVDSKSKN